LIKIPFYVVLLTQSTFPNPHFQVCKNIFGSTGRPCHGILLLLEKESGIFLHKKILNSCDKNKKAPAPAIAMATAMATAMAPAIAMPTVTVRAMTMMMVTMMRTTMATK